MTPPLFFFRVVAGGLVAMSCLTLLWPRGLQPARLLCPWGSPGKSTWMGCHALLQGVFLTRGSDPRLLRCRWVSCLASGFFTTEPPAVKKGSPFFFRKTSKRNRASFHPLMSLCPPRLFQTVTWTSSKFQPHVQSYWTLCAPERRADISRHGPQCPATSLVPFSLRPLRFNQLFTIHVNRRLNSSLHIPSAQIP